MITHTAKVTKATKTMAMASNSSITDKAKAMRTETARDRVDMRHHSDRLLDLLEPVDEVRIKRFCVPYFTI